MQLEESLDFQSEGDIRCAGTRAGVETILLAYLDEKEIAACPSVTREPVYGAILRYPHYREKRGGYLDAFIDGSRQQQERQDASVSPLVQRLREASQTRSVAV